MESQKARAPLNRTITLTRKEVAQYSGRLLTNITTPLTVGQIEDKTICQDFFSVIGYLPQEFVDLLIIDPPYNLNKQFNTTSFRARTTDEYRSWFESWFGRLVPALKSTATAYICCDWRCSAAIQAVAEKYLIVRNRITWEREKGRGALSNWKNCSEDIWFCTVSDDYFFNADAVKLRRRVIAPYTTEEGHPKDWEKTDTGNFRSTHPSNLWTDITVPFWSMPENTDHPTQKPEKLVAKLVLASSRTKDFVFDPFLGSGTTSVVAKKLGRRFAGVEVDHLFACLAEKRIVAAETDRTIQGYASGVFWERNTLTLQARTPRSSSVPSQETLRFFEEPYE
jgi:site-specific DNA-methyltransferase (adenine-specific)